MCFGKDIKKIAEILSFPSAVLITSYLTCCFIIFLIKITIFHFQNNQLIRAKIKIALLHLLIILLRFVFFFRALFIQFNLKVEDTRHLLI